MEPDTPSKSSHQSVMLALALGQDLEPAIPPSPSSGRRATARTTGRIRLKIDRLPHYELIAGPSSDRDANAEYGGRDRAAVP
jgi:hypothetical protein